MASCTGHWSDLQSWWQDTHHISGEAEAKKSLYARLRRNLPDNPSGHRNLFALHQCHDHLGAGQGR
ncbi:hypothetical protein ACIPUC_14160 [Streptomyces sp. LARHCF249]